MSPVRGETATFLIPDAWASISPTVRAGVDVEDADDAVVAAEHRAPVQRIDGARVRLRLERAPDLQPAARSRDPTRAASCRRRR